MTALIVTTLTPGTKPLPGVRAARGLRGAFTNLPYVGPARIGATTKHATGIETGATDSGDTGGAGGNVTTDGYRAADDFGVQSLLGSGEIEDSGLSAADAAGDAVVIAAARPSRFRSNQATPGAAIPVAFTGEGVPGGSTQSSGTTASPAGGVFDTTGRAESTGLDRFGRAKGVANAGAGLGHLDYSEFDRSTTVSGSAVAVGDSIKTISTGTNQPDSLDGDTVAIDAKYVGGPRLAPGAGSTAATTVTPTLPPPLFDTTATASGTIAFTDGTAAIDVDIHDDDQSAGSADRAGIVAAVYKVDTDNADEDGPLVRFASVDLTAGAGTIIEFAGAASDGTAVVTGDYRIYARFRAARPAAAGGGYIYGPVAKTTLTVA
jgi:hypothetical protein